eukprot:363432-Chlamydomonas_euryale.AAC.4
MPCPPLTGLMARVCRILRGALHLVHTCERRHLPHTLGSWRHDVYRRHCDHKREARDGDALLDVSVEARECVAAGCVTVVTG